MLRHRVSLFALLLCTLPSFSSAAWAQPTLELLDLSGAVATSYVEGSRAFVRVTDAVADVSPGQDSVEVRLSTPRAGDLEILTLTETGAATGVFRGSIPLAPGSAFQPGVLETATDPNPPYDRDTIEADYNSGAATASTPMAGSRIWFLDGYGRVRQSFAVGERVYVRIADSLRNNPSQGDSFEVLVTDPVTFDQERVLLVETGTDTGIFEGSVATADGFTPQLDGVLGTGTGYTLHAEHPDADAPTSSMAAVQMLESIVELIDAQGRPAQYYLESSRVYVQVENHVIGSPSVVNSVLATMETDIAADHEVVVLTETGPSTGIFRSSLALVRGSGIPNNGLVETSYEGPPYHFDTVRATSESGSSTAAVRMLGSLTSFVDAYGKETDSYPAGVSVRMRVEDQNFNNPSAFDTVGVTVTSLATGDAEGLALQEIAKDSGVFEGAVPMRVNDPASSSDGLLQVQEGEEIEAMHVDFNGVLASGDWARMEGAAVAFIDAAGRPTAVLLENAMARIRVISLGANASPAVAETLQATVRSLYTGDQEGVTLTETGSDTSLFEGSIHLAFLGTAFPGDNLLEVFNPPPYLGDEVTASYGPYSAKARTVGALAVFIDDFGRETTSFPLGAPVRVRVTDPTRDSPTVRDTAFISLSTCLGDLETIQITETGFVTRVFEGTALSGTGVPFSGDGILQGVESCLIEAFYPSPNGSATIEAQATFTGGEVLFVDAQGQPASVYLEGTRAYLRVVDHGRSDTVPVTVTAELSNDQETVTLHETASGVFTGSIELQSSPVGTVGNGVVETSETQGPPHELETLRAVYQDEVGSSTATATTLNFRIWFIDAYGSVTDSYAYDSRVYVRVEDHNLNNPFQFDRRSVTVYSSRGDAEPLELLETGKSTGIYEGSIELDGSSPPVFADGSLQAGPDDELEAQVDLLFNAAPAQARVEASTLSFIDEAGVPTVELLENGTARVRAVSPGSNANPNQADGLQVQLQTLYLEDQEAMLLTETGVDTNVFEGSIQLSFAASSSQGNGVLETGTLEPEFLGDEVTASFGAVTAKARTIGARAVFIDGFGRETTVFPLGAPVRVRVTDPSRNTPLSRNDTYVTLTACGTDQETFQLFETNFNTAIFEGEVPSFSQSGSSNDGTLQGSVSCQIRAYYSNPNSPVLTEAQATFTGGEVLFVDAQGQPASVYLEGTRAYLRVVDHGRSGTVSVGVTTELSHDQETVTLNETASGVFTGSIVLQSSPVGAVENGVVETSEVQGPPHEFETLRAAYQGEVGSSTTTASTLNFRIWFIDAYGSVTDSFAYDSRVYVRVEDHNLNNPFQFDRRSVTVYSSRGDAEPLELLETGKLTGIYEGFLDLEIAPPVSGDGLLQASAEEQIEARVDFLFNASPAQARIEFSTLSFIDEAGVPTVELLENGTARVRAVSPGSNANPNQADGLQVQLQTLYLGDQEALSLTETGVDTNVFEGTIQLSFAASSSQSNGVLETGNLEPELLGEEVTASFRAVTAKARTIGARVVFIDGFGRKTTAFPLGAPVRVRVTDPSRNTPLSRNDTYVALTACGTDQESLQLFETNFNTAVFEGEIPSFAQSGSPNDGSLQGSVSCQIRAYYANPNSSLLTEAEATFTGGEVLFVDTQGQPASVYLEGTRAHLRVVDHSRSGTVPVTVTAELSNDQETVTLNETEPGVFTGSIVLQSSPVGAVENGVVETAQVQGPPHEFETLRAVYQEPSGTSTATATTLSYRVWFIDASGTVVSRYVQGSRVYVRLEDHNFNNPGLADRLYVDLTSSRGDFENIEVNETGVSTGIYEGSVSLSNASSAVSDGILQAGPGDEITLDRNGPFVPAPVRAQIDAAAIFFVDGSGAPTVELLEDGTAWVRVFNPGEIGNLSLPVQVSSLLTGDQEGMTLIATDPEAGVFEGSIQLSFSASASQGNGVLETSNQGPEFLGDQVTASYGPYHATARTVASLAMFLNLRGQPTSTYSLGDTVRVRIEHPSRNSSPAIDSFQARVRSLSNGDEEFPFLTETSPTSGIFEASVSSTLAASSLGDGVLSVGAGDVVEVENPSFHRPTSVTARAIFLSNQAPQAVNDAAETIEEQNVIVSVLGNDSDPDPSDVLSVSGVTQGIKGSVEILGQGSVVYTPNVGETGEDTFTYYATDSQGGEAAATVTITITPLNRPPVANDDIVSVTEDGMVDINVLANDTDPEDNFVSVETVTQGTNGSVSINPDNTVKYTPVANYHGADSFTYTASDGNGGTATATVTLTVTAINDSPVANADAASVAEDDRIDIAVLSNDTDPENDTLTVTAVVQGAHGTVAIQPDSTVRYGPAANYSGSDSFTYTISDGNGGTATATVTVTVAAINDSPLANADAASVAEDDRIDIAVLSNDTDPENDTLTVTAVTQGAHGTVAIQPDSTVRYGPAANYSGSDSFTYTISDGNGGTATATVSVTVTAVNDSPVAVNDTATVVAGASVTIPVRDNDTDVDSPTLTVTAVTQGALGSVTINAGQTVTYTAGLFTGADDTFTYTVSDGTGGTSTATVTVSLAAPPRVTTNLQVRYDFNEGSGSTVNDTSGVGTPINLTISPASAVSWLPGALSVNSATVISSASAATKVINAVRSSSAITVEAWVAADNLTQTGPARIVSINKNASQSNLIFGQSATRYETRTSTASGTRTQQTPVNSASTSLKHVVYTRNSAGLTVTYINGVQVVSATATGSMSNWDTTMRLALANAIGGGKPWVGDLHLVAIYSRSLTATEVLQNFQAGATAP